MRRALTICKKQVFLAVIACLLGLGFGFVAQAQLIRDTEIENALRVYSHPLIKEAGLDIRSVRILIVNNESLNAFVAGGQKIFIHSGTLVNSERAEEVIGVIAHELGHIAGGHLAAQHSNAKRSAGLAILTAAVGVPLAILGGQSGAAAGAVIAGQSIGTQNFLAYSRDMENAADQAAIRYVHASGLSADGLVDFLARLQKLEQISGGAHPYLRSHPLTETRIQAAKKAVKDENIKPEPSHKDTLAFIHDRIRGKLAGYLWSADQVSRRFPKTDNSLTARYARTFSAMRAGKTKQALKEIDALLQDYPNDIFFLESKGDIYRNSGDMQKARQFYGKALQKAPWAALIHAQWAQSLTQSEYADKKLVAQAIKHVNKALQYESKLFTAWRAKATLENAAGRPWQATIATAETAMLKRDYQRALYLAEKAMPKFPEDSKEQRQAQDIIFHAKQKIKLQK